MDRAGIETWLVNVLRKIDRSKYQFDFVVHEDREYPYEQEVIALGSKVYRCINPDNLPGYLFQFAKILKENQTYDIVHSHIHHYSGFVLFASLLFSRAIRIASSYTNDLEMQARAPFIRRAYFSLTRALLNLAVNGRTAVNDSSGVALFGKNWLKNSITKIVDCGIDIESFSRNPKSLSHVRESLGIGQEDFVIGHIGRFVDAKNHTFLLRIFHEVLSRIGNARLLLIGTGPLKTKIEEEVIRLQIENRVIFAPPLESVVETMLGAMDCFVFPSLYEGQPLVLIEAQAAGLPIVMSNVIPSEVVIDPEMFNILSLEDPVSNWASAVLDRRKRFDGVSALTGSRVDVRNSIGELESLYKKLITRKKTFHTYD